MGKEVMGKKENEMAQEKERPAGSQSLFRGLMLIEILSNYPNGCPLAQLSKRLSAIQTVVRWRIFRSWLV